MESGKDNPLSEPPSRENFAWIMKPSGAVLFIVALYAFGSLLLFFAMPVFLMVIAGALLAVLFRTIGQFIAHYTRIPPFWATLLGMVALLGAMIGVAWILAPRIADQFVELARQVPQSIERIRQYLAASGWGQHILSGLPTAATIQESAYQALYDHLGTFSAIFSALAAVIVILIVGIFSALEPHLYAAGFLKLLPQRHRPGAGDILAGLFSLLQRWLFGRIVSMTVVGVLTGIGLWAIGIPLALTLGIVTGISTFIPNIGAIVAAVPAILLGLVESPSQGLYALIVVLTTQCIESYIVTPLVQQQTISIPPALLIVAQLLMGVLYGTLGLFVAAPLAAMGMYLVNHLYIKPVLRDQPAV
jgi:predicted PurR-regulated permease PerM